MLVDSHCHLDFPDFAGEVPEIIRRAQAAGVGRMVTICTRLKEEPNVRAIAESSDAVFYAVGVHPLNVGEEPQEPSLADLVAFAEHPRMVGIGETGLDYHYDRWPHDLQARLFRTHVAAARETGLPLIVHARDADEDVAALLEEEHAKGAFPCVMHCFSSGRELARRTLAIGACLSFSGVAAFKSAEALRSIFDEVPLERVLVETDAPYLAPPPHRGKRNEPAYVAETARVLAERRGMTPEAFAEATTANFHRLFSKIAP
ncbi:TatD family hydrolase [Neomegalonema perideroedes]|uniref:TatD family hydrolase n=1 Tax=Neomegalonema perideroedes TaxID=217219 RepID=UPI0003642E70|nr:TatD family hydrolase [Neomegalonema perideroedes]